MIIALSDENWIEKLEKIGSNVPGLKAEEPMPVDVNEFVCNTEKTKCWVPNSFFFFLFFVQFFVEHIIWLDL